MQCPKCSAENPDQARFCMNCAAPLVLICPECGTELRPAARFCCHCAAPVEQHVADEAIRRLVPREYARRGLAASGTVGKERRIVTILFPYVKGSIATAEEQDREDWGDHGRRLRGADWSIETRLLAAEPRFAAAAGKKTGFCPH